MDTYTVPPPKHTTLACGNNGHAAAVRVDGTVQCWGEYYDGKCSGAAGITDVVSVACGGNHTVALLSDGTVRCWGFDKHGQCSGAAGITDAVGIAAGTFHTAALLADGTVRCWGNDEFGQCSGAADMRNVVMVACSDYTTYALLSNCTIQASREDTGTDGMRGITNAVKIACGPSHGAALRADGTVRCWGYDGHGKCSSVEGITGVIDVACGAFCTLVLLSDNTIRVCGFWHYIFPIPSLWYRVRAWWQSWWWQRWWRADDRRIVALACNAHHIALLLMEDGTVQTWGGPVMRVATGVRMPCERDMTPPGAYLLK